MNDQDVLHVLTHELPGFLSDPAAQQLLKGATEAIFNTVQYCSTNGFIAPPVEPVAATKSTVRVEEVFESPFPLPSHETATVATNAGGSDDEARRWREWSKRTCGLLSQDPDIKVVSTHPKSAAAQLLDSVCAIFSAIGSFFAHLFNGFVDGVESATCQVAHHIDKHTTSRSSWTRGILCTVLPIGLIAGSFIALLMTQAGPMLLDMVRSLFTNLFGLFRGCGRVNQRTIGCISRPMLLHQL